MSAFVPYPKARSSAVAGNFFFLSMWTKITSWMSIVNSTHEPRNGMMRAEKDFLLDDVLRSLRLGRLPHLFHHHELQRRLEWDGVRHVPLDALLDGVLGLPEPVLHELEGVVPVHVLNREDVLEHALQPDVGALGALAVRLQQRRERARLDVQEMRHRHPLVELSERQNRQCLRHVATSGKRKRPHRPRPQRRSGKDRGARASEQVVANPRMSSTKGDPSRADGPVWPAALAPASTSVRRPHPALRASF